MSDTTVPLNGGPGDRPASADHPEAPPGFELLNGVGRGGMGVVYRARDLSLSREVAIKYLQDRFAPDSTAADRFIEEAHVTGQLQHPGVPAVHQVGALTDGQPHLVIKILDEFTPHYLINQGATIDPLAIFEDIAQTVGYAHAHGVVHRDLKPANVMVGGFGETQLMDWGLAKVLEASAQPGRAAGASSNATTARGSASDPDTTTDHEPTADPNATTDHEPMVDADATTDHGPATGSTRIRTPRGREDDRTRAGSVMGTPAYMSPEQAAGEVNKVDARSDVFGLGAILCALLTGKPPFGGRDSERVRQAAARGETTEAFARLDSSGADPDVIALRKRCLAFEPSARPAGATPSGRPRRTPTAPWIG